MCMVSAVMDHGRRNPPWKYPQPRAPWEYPYPQPRAPWEQPLVPAPWKEITPSDWDWLPKIPPLGREKYDEEIRDALKKYLELVDKAKQYDEVAGEPDCEDPKKAEFLTEVNDRLAEIEKRLATK